MEREEYLKASEEGVLTNEERIEMIALLLEWWLGDRALEWGNGGDMLKDFIASPYYHPSFGGQEGGGESIQQVVRFVELDLYFKRSGYYQSYDGSTWYKSWGTTYPTPVTYNEYN
jgi:hypothetical protein